MPFTVNSLIIEKALRGMMIDPNTGKVSWSVDMVEDPSITVNADTEDAVDAQGTPIMTFNKAKSIDFAASNSLFNLDLLAGQSGTTKEVATSAAPIISPIFDDIKATEADKLLLLHTPYIPTGETYGIKCVYRQNGDGTLGESFEAADTLAPGKFTITDKELTFNPGDVKVGNRFLAVYEYQATGDANNGAVSVKNTAKDFPVAGKFVLEALMYDPCDTVTKIYGYVVMPNAKLAADFDLGLKTDSKHPFKLRANQDYCDPDKVLLNVIIPESGAAA